MQQFLDLFPLVPGLIVFNILALGISLGCYGLVRWIFRSRLAPENTEIAAQLIRVSGALLALLLSLTFADVRSELGKLRDSVELEAAQIVDMYNDLAIYEHPQALALQKQLREYVRTVIENDWDKLAYNTGKLGAYNVAMEIQRGILQLPADNSAQEALRANLLLDMDEISDYRQIRLYAAKSEPPVFFYISFFGFLITMGLMAVYPPKRNSLILMGLYCVFIGVVIYFILALGSPFSGTFKIKPKALSTIYETILS